MSFLFCCWVIFIFTTEASSDVNNVTDHSITAGFIAGAKQPTGRDDPIQRPGKHELI
jgi:hypothetical protein